MDIFIKRELSLKAAIVEGAALSNYALTTQGDLFKQDKISKSWVQVEVTRANGDRIPTRANINGESHSIVTLYKDTYNISKSQSYRTIKKRYGSESHCIEYKEKQQPLVETYAANIFAAGFPSNIFAGSDS